MTKFEKTSFLQDESGAVNVDWVVLSAAVIGLTMFTMGLMKTGLTGTATVLTGDVTSQVNRLALPEIKPWTK